MNGITYITAVLTNQISWQVLYNMAMRCPITARNLVMGTFDSDSENVLAPVQDQPRVKVKRTSEKRDYKLAAHA
jgi:thiamine pyrophosphokinase